MGTPSISVVIPAFNASATIAVAIDSVLGQTSSVSEIIVVDDGSTDNMADVVLRYNSDVRLIQQTNSRTAAARNLGLDQATGDWIAFLDADDYWEPNKIERQLSILNKHPEVNVLAARNYNQTPGMERQLPLRHASKVWDRVTSPRGSQAFQLGTMMWTGTVMVKREVIQGERFVSGLEPAEDRDLWIRLAASGSVFLDSTPLATAVLEPGSISRGSISVDCKKMLEVIDRNASLLNVVSRLYWRSYIWYRWAAIDPSPRIAIPMLIRSMAGWPLPFRSMPAMKPFGRIKRLAFLLKSTFVSALKHKAIV